MENCALIPHLNHLWTPGNRSWGFKVHGNDFQLTYTYTHPLLCGGTQQVLYSCRGKSSYGSAHICTKKHGLHSSLSVAEVLWTLAVICCVLMLHTLPVLSGLCTENKQSHCPWICFVWFEVYELLSRVRHNHVCTARIGVHRIRDKKAQWCTKPHLWWVQNCGLSTFLNSNISMLVDGKTKIKSMSWV